MRQYGLNTVEEFENFATERMNLPVEDLMDQLRDKVLSQAVIGQEVGSKLVIPQADIEKYYEEHKDEFVRSEGIRLREILITADGKTGQELPEAEIRAKEVLGRVKKGEVFAEIARRFSDNTASAPNGGDIGIFRRGQLKAEIENEVFSQDQGYITDLIEVPGGYLILKVEERHKEGLAGLKEVEAEIRGKLSEPLWDPALRTYLSDLRSDAYIEIRPGYVDAGAVAGMDTSWSDPAKLTPVTTTKENVLQRKKKRRFLGIPLPGLPGRTRPSPATSGESDSSTDGP
jgi:peptidyl-prolyl cis-trans isomerase SurA